MAGQAGPGSHTGGAPSAAPCGWLGGKACAGADEAEPGVLSAQNQPIINELSGYLLGEIDNMIRTDGSRACGRYVECRDLPLSTVERVPKR